MASFYTRKQVQVLLGVHRSTLIRWAKLGKPPRPVVDPMDPLRRVLYNRPEVEQIARIMKDGSMPVLPIEPGDADFELARYESLVPGPLAASIFEMLRERKSIEEICRAAAVPPEYVLRLQKLQRTFEAERGPPPAPRALMPRIVTDETDPELAAWAKKLDAERDAQRRSEHGAELARDPPEPDEPEADGDD